ncbi:MAG: type IV secretion system DNA-binding domain-containing protein [Anaerolineae bacterium]
MSAISFFEVRIPQPQSQSPPAATAVVTAITRLMKDDVFSFRITATVEGLRWGIATNTPSPITIRDLEQIITPYYSGAEIAMWQAAASRYPYHERFSYLARVGDNWLNNLAPVSTSRSHDPLALLTQAMQELLPGEELSYQVVTEMYQHSQAEIENILSVSAYEAGWRAGGGPLFRSDPAAVAGAIMGTLIGNLRLRGKRVLRYSEAETEHYLVKLRQPLGICRVRVIFDTPHPNRLGRATAVTTAAMNLVGPGGLRLGDGLTREVHMRSAADEEALNAGTYFWQTLTANDSKTKKDSRLPYTWWLSPEEINLLWHLPTETFAGQSVVWASALPAALRQTSTTEDSYVIGLDEQTAEGAIRLKRRDRSYHALVTGQTGMGKSTLLHNLIHQDIAGGQGVVVLDPHGSLIGDILKHSIPAARRDEVVLLPLGDAAYPVPLNPLRAPAGVEAQTVFNTMLWTLKSIYADSWSATRMELVIRNVLQAVLTDAQATPLDVQEMLLNAHYRRRRLAAARQSGLLTRSSVNFWEAFERASPSEQQSQTQPVLSRLNAFLGSPLVEKMTCHPHTLDFEALMREKKIVLVNLQGNGIATEVGSLGAILFAQLFLASQRLGAQDGSLPPRCYLYVDEAQRYITTAFPSLFSEARKFGLSLTLACQYLGQLDEETQDGVVNNVGTTVSFECSPDEARQTAKLYEPAVSQEQLIRLGKGRAAVRTRLGGQTLPAFVVKTRPPPPAEAQSATPPAELVERSRRNLGLLPLADVDAWLDRRYSGDAYQVPPEASGLHDFE